MQPKPDSQENEPACSSHSNMRNQVPDNLGLSNSHIVEAVHEQKLPPAPARILLIGVGPFAKRAYIPRLHELAAESRAVLVAAVDVEQNQAELEKYRQAHCPDVELHFVPFFTLDMPIHVNSSLTALVSRLRISCVIISTEPLAHRAYGLWALDLGLNVVMDKPVSTRPWVVEDLGQALGIAEDFDALMHKYESLQSRKKTCFLINSHRRYHHGFQHAIDLVRKIQGETGCPVTSINTLHCDGQWRLPSEIISQDYHTYNKGYGKVSHSGYHAIDIVYQFLKAGMGKHKKPDTVEVFSSFVRPRGFFSQINEGDYKRLFGDKAYKAACPFNEQELHEITRRFGEIDASVQLTFYSSGEPVALVHLDLQHNGFGRRTWLTPGQDLYKGNGRVRHEMHEIKSGPFQSIVIDSRQSSDVHDVIEPNHTVLGGNGHFDINVYNNCGMLGTDGPLHTLKLDDLVNLNSGERKTHYSRSIKHAALDEAIDFMAGVKKIEDLKSNLPDHSIPAHIMSAIYVSYIRRSVGLNPVVSLPLKFINGKSFLPG